MKKLLFRVEDKVCDECALALRRFIGHREGVKSVEVEDRKIAVVFDDAKIVVFDDAKITDEGLFKLTTDSLEKLGHKLIEHWHFS